MNTPRDNHRQRVNAFGCVWLFALALVVGSLGCGAVEQHEADKAQEATLAALAERLEAQDAMIERLAVIFEQLRVRLANIAKLMGVR